MKSFYELNERLTAVLSLRLWGVVSHTGRTDESTHQPATAASPSPHHQHQQHQHLTNQQQ